YYTLLVMAAYAGWRLLTRVGRHARNGATSEPWRREMLKTGGWFLVLVLMGVMLGALQFIPFYEVGSANFREGSASLDDVRGWAFPERRVLTLALPNFFGNPTHHSYMDVFSGEHTPFTLNA